MASGHAAARRTTRGPSPLVVASVMAAACLLSAVVGVGGPAAGAGASPAGTLTAASSVSPNSTVWLCRPGQPGDPCAYDEGATSVSATGSTSPVPRPRRSAAAKKFDCFYVYPTVSTETSANADLVVQPAEKAAAVVQASRFSQVCNVWAPMYRQATDYALTHGLFVKPAVENVAYASVLAGWRDYLAHHNDGRPIIFIGHSQGAAMLIRLLRSQVDSSPTLRKQLVSAIILGGNVQVPLGHDVGGSFRHIPACGSQAQTGCVIAYSTFGSTPPPLSLFGRPGQGVSPQSGQTAKAGQQVVCVNPVTFSGSTGALQSYFLTAMSPPRGVTVSTPWVTYPGLYRATCENQDGASWLQVDTSSGPGDPRPVVTASLGPLWGYHLDDVNLALGSLVNDVAAEESAYH